jgi:hypothetical protein
MMEIEERSKKIFYIDNLKVGLITLVVVQHALITYGVEGGWYYAQKTTDMVAVIPMGLVAIINQSFLRDFSSFFLLISCRDHMIERARPVLLKTGF